MHPQVSRYKSGRAYDVTLAKVFVDAFILNFPALADNAHWILKHNIMEGTLDIEHDAEDVTLYMNDVPYLAYKESRITFINPFTKHRLHFNMRCSDEEWFSYKIR